RRERHVGLGVEARGVGHRRADAPEHARQLAHDVEVAEQRHGPGLLEADAVADAAAPLLCRRGLLLHPRRRLDGGGGRRRLDGGGGGRRRLDGSGGRRRRGGGGGGRRRLDGGRRRLDGGGRRRLDGGG